jgi:hypothetical protein
MAFSNLPVRWYSRLQHVLRLCGPGLAGLGSESVIDVKATCEGKDVKAARRFAELKRRAPIRAQRAKERELEINTFRVDIIPPPGSESGRRIACSARSLQLQTVQNQQLFW